MQVPLLDLKAQHASIRDELDAAIARVMERGQFVMAEEVEAFEEEWARYCGAEYAVGVSSGSDALYLCLRYLQEQEYFRRCITTPVSFWATTEAVLRTGLEMGFAEVDPLTGCLDLNKVEAGEYLTVVLPVSLYGYPAPSWAPHWSPSTIVLMDAAQAHGQRLETWAACFSHYPTKNLGAMGQAGSIVTNDGALHDWLRTARSHSEAGGRFRHTGVTGNLRLDEIQAAILRVKLPHLAAWNERRRTIAVRYDKMLAPLPGIKLQPFHPDHTYHIYAIRVTDRERDALAQHLAQAGIQTAIRYPIPLHKQPFLVEHGGRDGSFPIAEAWCREVLNLPIYETMSDDAVQYVGEQIRRWTEVQS